MKEKYKKLNELYETIDNNIENCIEESEFSKTEKQMIIIVLFFAIINIC